MNGCLLIFVTNGGWVAAVLTLPLAVALISLSVEVFRSLRAEAAPSIDLTAAEMPAPRSGSEPAADGTRERTTLS